tara:strand:+ start:1831 stop:2223 length:393 start_codon:yes stop_codon:yes gene_type:complete
MKHIALILFTCITIFCNAQENTDVFIRNKVVVKLLETIDTNSLPPYCGILMTQKTFKYKVIGVFKGNITDSIIYINRACIRELYEAGSLKNDQAYSLWLKKSDKKIPFDSCNYCFKPEKIGVVSYEVIQI